MIDEGESTCVMLISCWKALGSPELLPSNTLLISFDRRSFYPRGILPSFEIKLVGKEVSIEIELVDAPLDYNLLLGRNWTYAMCIIPSSVFRVLIFPHEGKLVIVYQLTYTRKGRMDTYESSVPLIDQLRLMNESLGVGMYT